MRKNLWLTLAATNGLLAVLAGAFGAHGLEGRLDPRALSWWHKAADYHIYHALALLGCACLASTARSPKLTWTGILLQTGIVLFSGSLYAMALTGQTWLGAITPIGGTAFLAGWALLAWTGLRPAPGESSPKPPHSA